MAKQWHWRLVVLKDLLGCDMEVGLMKPKPAAGDNHRCSAKDGKYQL